MKTKQKCDYCKKEAKYFQTFEVCEIETNEKEIIWGRFACKIHKDHSED